ncbi:ribonuclease H-like domain-containing protein [Tanacetum coccineum]
MADFSPSNECKDILVGCQSQDLGGNDESREMRKSNAKAGVFQNLENDIRMWLKYIDFIHIEGTLTRSPPISAFISAASTNSKMSYPDQSHSTSFTSVSSSPTASSNVMENELDKTEEPKALLSVDSMLNWSDHEGEDVEIGAAQVYGMIAGAEEDLRTWYKLVLLVVQAYKSTLQTLEQQKGWYQSNQLALEERIRILTANLENTTNMLKYTEKLNEQAKIEKLNDKVKLEESNARFDKWKDSSKNLDKLINSSMSSRSKFGLGFGDTFGSDEVFDLSAPSIFDSSPKDGAEKPLYDRFVKAVGMNVVPPPITGTFMPPSNNPDLDDTQFTYVTSPQTQRPTNFASCVSSVKSSSSKTNEPLASAPSSVDSKQCDRNSDATTMWKELQNLYHCSSLSQICDTKNKVLFTDKECLVLSKEFQLPESSQVVLRIPRRHNLYCSSLSHIQPERDVTCLLAKASLEESTKWHRRMAHKDYSNARTPQQNGVAERTNKTLIEATRTMLADSKFPTMFWTEAVSTACYVLNRVLVTKPHNKTPYELVSGKVPNISHLKPFGCLVTILNTSDHLGKFEGKADEGFIVGYAAHSKAYQVYNLSSKKIEETLNLRYLKDKLNVQGLGHEWYFDLDYLTYSLGYTRFKTNQPASTQDTNIHAGTQDDSDSECDEQVIVVPFFPSNSFLGPKVDEASYMVESSSDYVEELARLKKQAYEANALAEKHLGQADLAASRNRVPAGKIDSAAGVFDGPTETSTPVFTPIHIAVTSLPPGHLLGSSKHSTIYPSPSDLTNSMSSSSDMEDI